jgi:uncharacterized protein YggE
MKRIYPVATAILLLAGSAAASPEAERTSIRPPSRQPVTHTVRAQGSAKFKARSISATLTVREVATTQDKANGARAKKFEALQAALKAKHGEGLKMTSNVDSGENWNHEGQRPKRDGFYSEQRVTVTVPNLNARSAGAIVDIAASLDVQNDGVFAVVTPGQVSSARARAHKAMIRDAQRQAKSAALAGGFSVGQITEIRPADAGRSPVYARAVLARMEAADSAPSQITIERETVDVTADVVFTSLGDTWGPRPLTAAPADAQQ